MATKQDPLIEALVGLAANAAPLLERARASGMFARPVTPEPKPAAVAPDDAQKAALQDIIVAQAMKIHALEAEVARLTKS